MSEIPYGAFPRDDAYAGAAAFYRFRPEYPPAAFERIIEVHGLYGTGTLLDGGCGTGSVFLRLASRFDTVVAVDPSRAMLDVARRRLEKEGVRNVRLVRSRLEDLGPGYGLFRLATTGSAFHRMDRIAVADALVDRLEVDGALVVLDQTSPWTGNERWQGALRAVLHRWFGVGDGASERHEAVLARSRLSRVDETVLVGTHVHTAESLLGSLASTSFASPAALGRWRDEFERRAREAIEPHATDGAFPMRMETSIITARRGP